MKSRIWLGWLLAAVAGAGLVAGCGKKEASADGAAAAKIYKLTYSIFFPPMHVQAKTGMEWAAEVEKRSGGRIQIAVHPGSHTGRYLRRYLEDGASAQLVDSGPDRGDHRAG